MEEQNPAGEAVKTKSGIGCGPMLAFLIVLVILVLIGSNAAIGYCFNHCQGEDVFDCLLNRLEEPEPEGAVIATGTYSFKDYSVNVSANIPLEGGKVTGSMTGTCSGRVKGTFDGQNNGVVSGTIVGSCSPFIVNIPASAQFSGIV